MSGSIHFYLENVGGISYMSLTILLLLLFTVLLLLYGWRSKYFLLFAFLVFSTAFSMLTLMMDIARNSNYVVQDVFLIGPLETRLYALCRLLLRFPLSTLLILRNTGIVAYFGGIVCFVLTFSGSARFDQENSRRQPWQYILIGLFLLLFFLFYHPQTAYGFYRWIHTLPSEGERHSAITLLHILNTLMTGCVFAYLLWPVLYLLYVWHRGRTTFLAHYLLHLAVPFLILNISFFTLFFTGIFRPSCEDVLQNGFWRFSMPTRMPVFHSTVLPIVSFIVLVTMFIPLMRLHADYALNFFKSRGIRRNLDALYSNVRNVMHSEKNLLFSIRILAQDALDQEDITIKEEKLNKIIDICNESMDNLAQTLNNAHEMSVSTMRNDFIQAVETAISQVQIPPNVRIVRSFPSETLLLFFDLYHMTHAISNVLSNSLDALDAAKPESPEIRLDIFTSRSWVYFSVWDNGCGIPPKILHKVEQPYVSTKKKKNSWGIGLSYVFNVIRAHYGQMHISSKQNEYTQVEILLPRSRKRR